NTFMGPPGGQPPVFEGRPPGIQPMAPPQFLIHLLFLSIAYVLSTFMETFLFAQKKEEETIRNKNENLQTELKLLKSQINPHFLFNSLNNIYALSVIDSGRTQKSISYLSDMLRYVLYECEQEKVPLEKEVTYIENYIKLYSLKSSKKYPITIENKIANDNLKIAPMLFIPFMENALKHGNIDRITDVYVRIKIEANTDSIHFEIENSKSERPSVTDEVGGIGIENVKKRLAILYPKSHNLSIDETALAFKVTLKLDLNGNN
ncbi:MAG: sensor histidine kinase, partial [Flavobacteriales bacterium]